MAGGESHAGTGSKARCVKVHVASDEFQLNLELGDIVYVLEQDTTGWWGGYKQGHEETAWFPGSNVEMVRGDGMPDEPEEESIADAVTPKCFVKDNKVDEFHVEVSSCLETDMESPIRHSHIHAVASPQRRGSGSFAFHEPNFSPSFTPVHVVAETQPTQNVVQVGQAISQELFEQMKRELDQERRKSLSAQQEMEQMKRELDKERRASTSALQDWQRRQSESFQEKQQLQYEANRFKHELETERNIRVQKERDVEHLQEQVRRFSMDPCARPSPSPDASSRGRINMSLSSSFAQASPMALDKSFQEVRSPPVSREAIFLRGRGPARSMEDVCSTPAPDSEEPRRVCVAERVRSFEKEKVLRSQTPSREGLPLRERPSTRELRAAAVPPVTVKAAARPVPPLLGLSNLSAAGAGQGRIWDFAPLPYKGSKRHE